MGDTPQLATSANLGNILAIVDTKLRQPCDRASHSQVADSFADWARSICRRMDWIRLRTSAPLGRYAGSGSGGRSSTGLGLTRPGGHLPGYGRVVHTQSSCACHLVDRCEVVLARPDRRRHRMGNFPGPRLVVRNVSGRFYRVHRRRDLRQDWGSAMNLMRIGVLLVRLGILVTVGCASPPRSHSLP